MHGALMRAWLLGMFVPRNAEDERRVEAIREVLTLPSSPAPDATPLGIRTDPDPDLRERLQPLTDDEYLVAFDGLIARYTMLLRAYETEMVTATTREQESQLVELRAMLDG
jgi:hypothetical protein